MLFVVARGEGKKNSAPFLASSGEKRDLVPIFRSRLILLAVVLSSVQLWLLFIAAAAAALLRKPKGE